MLFSVILAIRVNKRVERQTNLFCFLSDCIWVSIDSIWKSYVVAWIDLYPPRKGNQSLEAKPSHFSSAPNAFSSCWAVRLCEVWFLFSSFYSTAIVRANFEKLRQKPFYKLKTDCSTLQNVGGLSPPIESIICFAICLFFLEEYEGFQIVWCFFVNRQFASFGIATALEWRSSAC